MWPNPQETADLVTFTREILKGKLHFLCSVRPWGGSSPPMDTVMHRYLIPSEKLEKGKFYWVWNVFSKMTIFYQGLWKMKDPYGIGVVKKALNMANLSS